MITCRKEDRMENDITSKIPVKQHLKNIRNVLGLIHELDRNQLPLAMGTAFLTVAKGYLQLLLSVGVLNSVTEKETWTQMAGFIGGLIFLIFFCQATEAYMQNRLEIKRNALHSRYSMLMSKKLMQMDFSMVDSPMLEKMRTRIYKDNNWGAGIYTVVWTWDWMFRSFFTFLGAFLLAFPVLKEVQRTKNHAALMFLLAGFLGILGYTAVRQHMQLKTNSLMMAEMFDSPAERAGKTSLSYEMVSEGGFPYQSGKDVRIYDGYELFEEYTAGRLSRYEHLWYKRLGNQFGKTAMITGFGNTFFSMIPYFIVAYVALAGTLQIGSLLQYAGALGNLVGAVSGMLAAATEIAVASRRQLSTLDVINLQDEMYKGKLPVEKRRDFEYEIEFSHVWFQYPGAKDYALKDFSLKLRIGEKLAIVGVNGSGKTTMIKLLCRLYEPQKGQILLNGVDIKKFRADEYRKLFSVVFQDLYLFPLKLGENVAGETSYDCQKVEKCLRDAGFGDRLKHLSNGMDTYLYKNYDDSGVEISGGEAQKIAIARALYKDSPFILLDEPTAALDPKAEYEIYSSFDKMVGKKTAIYISHRLSSCRFCDDIAVFDQGQLVQRGSHEELVRDEKGKYFELWSAQAQYYQ